MAEMKIDESQRLDTLDARGNWQYPSGSESGHVEIELPALPGSPNGVERLHARDFGLHVIANIESSMNRQGYLRTGPQQNPSAVLRHFLGCAEGSKLLDKATVTDMARLSRLFDEARDAKAFYAEHVRPFLLSLQPKRR